MTTEKVTEIFDALADEFGAWSDALGFPEDLRADEILSLWGDELPMVERVYLENFIERWMTTMDRQIAAQICAVCRRYTPAFCLKPVAGSRVCNHCRKELEAAENAREANPATRRQPSLFN